MMLCLSLVPSLYPNSQVPLALKAASSPCATNINKSNKIILTLSIKTLHAQFFTNEKGSTCPVAQHQTIEKSENKF